ncbi:MAG: hypothetical protein U0531_07275 [Dehalococcoidia bacterium]
MCSAPPCGWGASFLAAVAVPVARRFEPTTRSRIVREAGRRSASSAGPPRRDAGHRCGCGRLPRATLGNVLDGSFWRGPVGARLAEKLIVVAVMAAVSFTRLHRPGRRPRPGRGCDTGRLRRVAAWLARATALLAMAVIFLAVLVVRPLPGR